MEWQWGTQSSEFRRRNCHESLSPHVKGPPKNRAGERGRGVKASKSLPSQFRPTRSPCNSRKGARRPSAPKNCAGENGRGVTKSTSFPKEGLKARKSPNQFDLMRVSIHKMCNLTLTIRDSWCVFSRSRDLPYAKSAVRASYAPSEIFLAYVRRT